MTAPAPEFFTPWSVPHQDPHPVLLSFDPSAMTEKPEAKILPFVSGALSSIGPCERRVFTSLAARGADESAAPIPHSSKPLSSQGALTDTPVTNLLPVIGGQFQKVKS